MTCDITTDGMLSGKEISQRVLRLQFWVHIWHVSSEQKGRWGINSPAWISSFLKWKHLEGKLIAERFFCSPTNNWIYKFDLCVCGTHAENKIISQNPLWLHWSGHNGTEGKTKIANTQSSSQLRNVSDLLSPLGSRAAPKSVLCNLHLIPFLSNSKYSSQGYNFLTPRKCLSWLKSQ